ncbi:MAG: ribonuclease P protein component [Nitrospiraceae bacterium]|nr:ribonuclease P protein component [Nitrospiraceae bacterium]
MPGQERFPRNERLTHRKQFLYVYRTGTKQVGRGFVLYVARGQEQGRKMGCAVSRKVGNAVVRNRVKRFIREVYRKHRARFPRDTYFVLVARPASARLTYQECETEIRCLFQKGDLVGG